MSTERLHLTDSLLLEFDARVVASGLHGTVPALVLDRTAFYPEAGGQLGDRGLLRIGGRDITVRDVQVDDAGVVHHLLEAPVAGLEAAVAQGVVDERHRRDSMSQHTAQHMLSRAFFDAAGFETVSARLGSETSTIDLKASSIDRDVVARVEQRVNEAVLEDRPVHVLFPTPDELPALRLSKAPTVDRDIRVIAIDRFDAMPCGGTHCQRTGQVGPVHVLGLEKYKGLTRLSFVAGLRALNHFRATDALVRSVTATLTCTPAELAAVVARLKDDGKTKAQALGHVRAELARLLARQKLSETPPEATGTTWIFVERDGEDVEALRAFSSALASRADVVAVLTSRLPESTDRIVVVDRGASASADASKWLKSQTSTVGGRGGGRPEHAEGRLPVSADWAAIERATKAGS